MFNIAKEASFTCELIIDCLSLSFSLFNALMMIKNNHQSQSPLITICPIPFKCQRYYTNQSISFNLHPSQLATGEQLHCYIRARPFKSPTLPLPTGSSLPAGWQLINSRISSSEFALKNILCTNYLKVVFLKAKSETGIWAAVVY